MVRWLCVGVLLYAESPSVVNGNYEENLSVAAYMNYTRLFQQLPFNSPFQGSDNRAVAGEV